MAFHEVQFPTDISRGSSGGPGYSTAIALLDGGREQRVARWETPLRRYDVAYGVRTLAAMAVLLDFYVARQGAAHGFRFKDWQDFTTGANHTGATAATDYSLGTGDGSTTTFQLRKSYTSGGTTVWRNITKPVSGSVKVAVDGVVKTEGVDYSVNTVTGVVTLTVAPGAGLAVTAGCEFDVPCRFDEGADEALIAAHNGYNNLDLQPVGIVEIRDELGVESDYNYGGALALTLTVDTRVTPANGRALHVTCTTAGLTLIIPSVDDLAGGGPYFYLASDSASTEVFVVQDEDGNVVASIGAGELHELIVVEDS